MRIKPADKRTRRVISEILLNFMFRDWNDEDMRALISEVHERYFQMGYVDDQQIMPELRDNDEVPFLGQKRFLWLEPTDDKKMLPLLTLSSTDKLVHFRLYALLMRLDHNSRLQSLAMRFETSEGDMGLDHKAGMHDFCHAQFCNSIDPDIKPTTPAWIPDSQPSIPLDADNQVTLVLCMLISLYGGAYVYDKLSQSGDGTVLKQMQRVRALNYAGAAGST